MHSDSYGKLKSRQILTLSYDVGDSTNLARSTQVLAVARYFISVAQPV